MKNKIILIILFSILSVISIYFLVFYKNNSSINQSEINFKIDDTSSVFKIVIEKNENSIVLEKNENFWQLNNLYSANSKAINNLLISLTLLELKSPIPSNAKKVLFDKLSNSKKVSFFDDKNNLIKYFYIGEQTTNKSGNYMLLGGSENPYIIFISSVISDLNNYFNIDEMFWRDKTIFRYKPNNINLIAINYPQNKEKSFLIEQKENENYILKNNKNSENFISLNKEVIYNYLSYFDKIEFESFYSANENFKDSLNLTQAEFIFSVTDKNGNTNTVKAYQKSDNEIIDTDNFIAIFNNNEIIVVKYYNFDLLLKSYEYFSQSAN